VILTSGPQNGRIKRDIEWRNIAAFRNVAVHDYLGIDLRQTWDIVADDLPVLKRQIEAIVKDLGISTTDA
jgi:uncharacterized protein with HEPN domain